MEREELRVKLTAYVLGETTPAEAAEIERALEGSEELRAERARLEATIGLVQTHLAADANMPGLSPEASAALERAAEQRLRPLPNSRWYQRPSLRIAASVLFAGLVWAGYRATLDEGSRTDDFGAGLDGSNLAKAPAAERADPLDALQGLGYLGSGTRSHRDRAAEPAEERPKVIEGLRSLGYVDDYDAAQPSPSADERSTKAEPARAGTGATAGVERGAVARKGKDDEGDAAPFTYMIFGGAESESASTPPPASTAPKPAVISAEAPQVTRAELDLLRQLGYTDGSSAPATPPAPAEARVADQPKTVVVLRDRVSTAASSAPRGQGESSQGEPSRASTLAPASSGGVPETGAHADPGPRERLKLLGYIDGSDEDGLGYISDSSDDFFLGTGALTQSIDARAHAEQVLAGIDPLPNEGPGAMFFRFWGDNPFEYTVLDHLSTFSIDVDTASYTLARKYLIDGHLPTKAQVRTEEFVNYFGADVPPPTEGTFAIRTELAPSRFGERPDAWMLRVAVRGKDVSRDERQPLSLTFVVDTSGSMDTGNRLGLVKRSLKLLLGQLDARDSISIVTFSNDARLVLPMTSAARRGPITEAIDELEPNGGTNAGAGLVLGYRQAEANLAAGCTNRVVLLSDGVANVGDTNEQSLTKRVERSRKQGIYLNTIGVGMGNHNDALLEQLADKGDGVCNYVDDEAEARRALVENFTGAFEPIARDVKIQVEFDPAQVESYRLLGYENRAVADKDFRNDAVDAGEVHAGHQVVALYELVRTNGGGEAPLATVRLRWKRPYTEGVASPGDEVATEGYALVHARDAAGSFRATSAGYRKSVLVAQFAEFLRQSVHARDDSYDDLIAEVSALTKELRGDADFEEFARLVVRNRVLVVERLQEYGRIGRALDCLRRSAYLSAELRELDRRLGRSDEADPRPEIEAYLARVRWIRGVLDRLDDRLDDATLSAMQNERELLNGRVSRLVEHLAKQATDRK